ncbi:DUF3120 domain-containing protein [Pantanalinema rosaneae CENA516]|uniref:DUF3120 domain-containing protein n=1 Tax=Pantanalinema rosaneae TaxID=1620701 RepID=UPI003D701B87
MISYSPSSTPLYPSESTVVPAEILDPLASPLTVEVPRTGASVPALAKPRWAILAAAIFLVSVPVFIQAPLVRSLPLVSLGLTGGLWWFGQRWLAHPRTHVWGDLLLGFTWTWLAGSLYWGWLRWEPLLHLPVEAIGLPFAIWGIATQRSKIGNFFYLGSLLGTALTDFYFYVLNLIPYWRKLMQVSEDMMPSIFQAAIAQIQTPSGIGWAIILAAILFGVSLYTQRFPALHWWAFSGAVLSTILVDGLFWLAACAA